MTRLLILSFSPIVSDARVLKQVAEFSRDHEVVTCGYGAPPAGVSDHVRIPDHVKANDLNGRLITARLYRRAYWSLSAVSWCKDALAGSEWSVIIANDVETVPLALSLTSRYGVHADLHEYSPRLHEESSAWNRRIAPYVRWLCVRYVARAKSWTTVGYGLAAEYERVFGFSPGVVTNAAPYADVAPSAVATPIRLVHSGACLRNRHILEMIRGVQAAKAEVTFDLFLTPNDPAYLTELSAAADETPDRVRLNEPVPYSELAATLRHHDLGIHILAPSNFNNQWALPNKLFDYVQARLGVVIGPSPEMVKYVDRYGFGAVADGFSADDLARTLERTDRGTVERFKRSSDLHAYGLSAGPQVAVWRDAVSALERGLGS